MSKSNVECSLNALDNFYPNITLTNNVPFYLGRNKESQIRDLRCSKNHIEILASFDDYSVTVKQLGPNESTAKSKTLSKGTSITLSHGDIIETLTGFYKYEIVFKPPQKSNTSSSTNGISSTTSKKSNESNKRKNFFKDFGYVDKKNKMENGEHWFSADNGQLLYYDNGIKGSSKIASYDMDGTLILTKSGKVFAVNNEDWKIIFSEVKSKLKSLVKDGYKIVVFSNQAGIGTGKVKPKDIQSKFESIKDELGVPMQMFLAAGKTVYRKPYIAMWKYMEEKCNDGLEIDYKNSFYIGDAAGRPEIPKVKKKDHSLADRLFALNLDLNFYTPEEHFLGKKKEEFSMPEFIPKDVDASLPLFEPSNTKVPKHSVEVAVLVGFPGSGKSFVAKTTFAKNGFIAVNRDTLGSWQKCVSVMEKSITEGKSVVVDNTNPDVESRKRYIDAAKAKNVPIRCFIMKATKDHARHNNKFREYIGEDHSKVNDMIFNSFKSKYKEPTLSEGFEEIAHINFIPDFRDKNHEKIYRMFLLEK